MTTDQFVAVPATLVEGVLFYRGTDIASLLATQGMDAMERGDAEAAVTLAMIANALLDAQDQVHEAFTQVVTEQDVNKAIKDALQAAMDGRL